MCPLWVKNLLFHKYTLNNVGDVIRYFYEECKHSGPFDFLADDIDLEPFSNFEIENVLRVENPIRIRIINLEGKNWIFKVD